MEVRCGSQTRLIRMDILDRDMFDPAPKTPERTSWTMALLGRLDQALGRGVMERPIFALVEPTPPLRGNSKSDDLARLSAGAFGALFQSAPHKLSDLYRLAQAPPPPPPTVELLRTSPWSPVFPSVPQYPTLARMARIAGQVAFTLEVTSGGTVSDLEFLSGHVMLQKAVESEVARWKFPQDAAGQRIEGVIEFKINCASGGH
jgi:TonB family protein